MHYFKNINNEIFAYEDEDIEKVEKYNQSDKKEIFSEFISSLAEKLKNLTKIEEQEALAIANPPPTDAELAQQRISELKQKLLDTDYVALSDYDKDKPEILADRQAWRDEIRQLEQSL